MNTAPRPTPPAGHKAGRSRRRGPALAAFLALAALVTLTFLWADRGDTDATAGGSSTRVELHPHDSAPDARDGGHASPDTRGAESQADVPQEAPASGEGAAPGTTAGTAGAAGGPEGPADSPQRALAQAAGEQPVPGVPGAGATSGAPGHTSGLTERLPSGPGPALGDIPNPGGCLAEYGAAGQCLPAVPPSLAAHVREMEQAGMDPSGMTHHWRCDEVRRNFPDGLPVRVPGTDPQGLDRNLDGIACGATD